MWYSDTRLKNFDDYIDIHLCRTNLSLHPTFRFIANEDTLTQINGGFY